MGGWASGLRACTDGRVHQANRPGRLLCKLSISRQRQTADAHPTPAGLLVHCRSSSRARACRRCWSTWPTARRSGFTTWACLTASRSRQAGRGGHSKGWVGVGGWGWCVGVWVCGVCGVWGVWVGVGGWVGGASAAIAAQASADTRRGCCLCRCCVTQSCVPSLEAAACRSCCALVHIQPLTLSSSLSPCALQLYNFWRRSAFRPVYLRQTPSDTTGARRALWRRRCMFWGACCQAEAWYML